MSLGDKLDALGKIINDLKKYERKLNDLIHRLEIIIKEWDVK